MDDLTAKLYRLDYLVRRLAKNPDMSCPTFRVQAGEGGISITATDEENAFETQAVGDTFEEALTKLYTFEEALTKLYTSLEKE